MKGINVKKIAAFAGAAVLFGASVAVADVVYGNTQLVDQNGQPTVKVVVGSKAAITDGVAAANIAARIANEAYKSSTLTAALSGQATCSLGTDTATGSCSVVENSKKVVLEVVVPGQVAGTYTFKTLITDTIDRTLANRIATGSEETYSTSMTASDTSGTLPSPLRGSKESAGDQARLFQIGGNLFNGFAPFSVVDNQGGTGYSTYTEEQSFWVGSDEGAVRFSEYEGDVVVDKLSAVAYQVRFTGNDYGIPVCTGTLPSNSSDDWASCSSNSPARTDRHRVKVKFLGEEWIISSMDSGNADIQNSYGVVAGGEIKLAKEAKYGIINVGQSLDAGNFKVKLADISVATGATNEHPAIIDILDANDQVVGQITVNEGETYSYTQPGTSNTIKIHVYKTAPGFTLSAKWAEMAIYTDEITLKNNARYNLASSSDPNYKDLEVSLLWKNRDATTNSSRADHLRSIVLYQYQNFNALKSGDVYNFPKADPKFKLTYQGLDLEENDYVSVTLVPVRETSFKVSKTPGDHQACNDTVEYVNARLIKISVPDKLLSGGDDLIDGSNQYDHIYFDPIGLVGNASNTSQPATQFNSTVTGLSGLTSSNHGNYSFTNTSAWKPVVFWQNSDTSTTCYNWKPVQNGFNGNTGDSVRFDTLGETNNIGRIYFANNSSNTNLLGASPATFQAAIVFSEDAGKVNGTANNAVYFAIPFVVTDTQTVSDTGTFRFLQTGSTTKKIYYKGVQGADPASEYASAGGRDLKFITERGTVISDIVSTQVSFKAAKKVGMPTFQFAFADVAAASSANEYTMKVGDSQVFGGVTVKVKAIDATCGGSFVAPGGQPTCSVDTSGLSAVIKPDNTPSVEVSQPVKLSSKLVVLDSEASAVGPVITVGGPEVNTVTRAALEASDVDFNTTPVVVKEIGNKIVVAGKTAQDTLAAADQFLAGIQRK
ncbi:MAG: S-layer protein [Candidatus Anstonellaceae archaeon]